MAKPTWRLHPDRALPTDPLQREIAREIYASSAELPIISMHGHIDVGAIDRNDAFGDPAELLIIPDHYLVRMLVSQGLRTEDLGVRPLDPAAGYETDHRAVWRRFAENWKLFRGTPTRYWMEHELVEVFGITEEPSAASADAIYDQLSATLARPEFRIRELFNRFNIEVLSTTDAPDSDLSEHAALAADGWGARVIPTFRPDGIFYPDRAGWRASIRSLATRNGTDITDYRSFLAAVQERRFAFVAAGALATDHGHLSADTTPLSASDAERIFAEALQCPVDAAKGAAFAANMLFESARMSVEDGLVMQLHPGVQRDHSDEIAQTFGPDHGFDIPRAIDYTRGIHPLLNAFGLDPRFRIILFTIDETVYSRELAPLAGAYPSVRLGAPWWFLDSPGGMARFRELVTETAGFYNTSGFVDDTRAFTSIPARHDLSRRIDAGYLAKLVAEHRLSFDEATETAIDLAYTLPLLAYKRRDAGETASTPAQTPQQERAAR
ncbi:glucuronate isomerase [Cryobacterium psychrophilum]|uniref:Uronate isomerase n=1 Tax=Cryobacterium psychrophilum TaxID=41988 RepID=A0A4Y8KP33_9MICO|nr:glucuronate isomerase [Cryobacterium psychrophilum]TDW30580.1 glucuronate isomerase [Cryobacterium psychrophilum]TFD80203.1 glucuronate isomerase [Cryobacterium psychrophilum]